MRGRKTMKNKLVRIGWFNLLLYRLFYWRWNKLFAARQDLWNMVRGTPSQPLYVGGEMRKIVNYRTGRCAGCEWHPHVCNHCRNNFLMCHPVPRLFPLLFYGPDVPPDPRNPE